MSSGGREYEIVNSPVSSFPATVPSSRREVEDFEVHSPVEVAVDINDRKEETVRRKSLILSHLDTRHLLPPSPSNR
jgi:hypothetical protein